MAGRFSSSWETWGSIFSTVGQLQMEGCLDAKKTNVCNCFCVAVTKYLTSNRRERMFILTPGFRIAALNQEQM